MRKNITDSPAVIVMLLIAALSFISMLIVNARNQDTIEVYDTPNHVQTVEEEEETLDYESQIFIDNENRFSFSVPADWQKVTKSGYPTFVHRESGSSIQVQVSDYDPSVNAMNAEQAAAILTNNGYTFAGYTRMNATQYEVLYQDYGNTIFDYIEEVFWDRSKIIKFVCTFEDANYDRMLMYYKTIFNSFVWDKQAPIPDGYHIEYIAEGGFETGVPDTWVSGMTDTSFYAMDDASGASVTVTPLGNIGYLDDFNSMDMTSLIQNGKPSFILERFSTSHEKAQAESMFIEDNVQYRDIAVLYSKGGYSYLLEMIYASGSIDETIPQTCAGLFRITVEGNEEETGTHNESGFSQQFQNGVDQITGGDTIMDDITEEDVSAPEEK